MLRSKLHLRHDRKVFGRNIYNVILLVMAFNYAITFFLTRNVRRKLLHKHKRKKNYVEKISGSTNFEYCSIFIILNFVFFLCHFGWNNEKNSERDHNFKKLIVNGITVPQNFVEKYAQLKMANKLKNQQRKIFYTNKSKIGSRTN